MPRDVRSNAGPTGFTVTVGPNDIVSCLVRNQQQPLPRLTLVKQVVNNNGGTAVADGVDVRTRPVRRRSPGPPAVPR